ncbi:secretin N-terminal domain-containing protein [Chrysiogenes arsenatis]|uniref:secretin N-terminal domain-containing protein n=1 Tax=Chrysiogenes arsenatis TaxID=309797 RepID=UPI000425E325|nr:secretin N-terminal domain-containing protein [Chrysiogenes arsenatis]
MSINWYGSVVRLALVLLCSLSIWIAPTLANESSGGSQQASGDIVLNFDSVSIEELLSLVSDVTGKNFVYDPAGLRKTLSLYSRNPLPRENLFPLFTSILDQNGMSLVEEQGVYHVIPNKDVIRRNPPLKGEAKLSLDATVRTFILPLDYLDATQTVNVIRPFLSPSGIVTALKEMELLVITDTERSVLTVRRLLEAIDRKSQSVVLRSIEILHAPLEDVVKKLGTLLVAFRPQDKPVILDNPQNNSVIVAGHRASVEYAQEIIQVLDTPRTTARENTQIFTLQYAKAEGVATILTEALKSTAGGEQAPSFTIIADAETNNLLFSGAPELSHEVKRIVERLDLPKKQVLVEALIMETSVTDRFDLGVNWQVADAYDQGQKVVSGAFLPSGALQTSSPLAGTFSLGVLGRTISYQGNAFATIGGLVNALRKEGHTNILMNPQILTSDNTEAEVMVGENRPFMTSEKYYENDARPVSTYEYRDVGISLKIKPLINEKNDITLDIAQEITEVADVAQVADRPITRKRNTKTTVTVPDGGIMVLSGLLKDNQSNSVSGVPCLMGLPILGQAFRGYGSTTDKTNLMIFIRVKVLENPERASDFSREQQKLHEQSLDEWREELGGQRTVIERVLESQ